jgi:hypothetical protein
MAILPILGIIDRQFPQRQTMRGNFLNHFKEVMGICIIDKWTNHPADTAHLSQVRKEGNRTII